MGDIQNAADDLVGKAKETAGDVTENESLKDEGKADQVVAAAKDKLSDVGDAIKDAANKVVGSFKDDEK